MKTVSTLEAVYFSPSTWAPSGHYVDLRIECVAEELNEYFDPNLFRLLCSQSTHESIRGLKWSFPPPFALL